MLSQDGIELMQMLVGCELTADYQYEEVVGIKYNRELKRYEVIRFGEVVDVVTTDAKARELFHCYCDENCIGSEL